jgi:hypothetical protein
MRDRRWGSKFEAVNTRDENVVRDLRKDKSAIVLA